MLETRFTEFELVKCFFKLSYQLLYNSITKCQKSRFGSKITIDNIFKASLI